MREILIFNRGKCEIIKEKHIKLSKWKGKEAHCRFSKIAVFIFGVLTFNWLN